jgi:hypothetical protein
VTTQPSRENAAPQALGATPEACPNCGQARTGRFCAACGQEVRPLDPSLREILGDAWEAITDLEGRAFQSLGRLLISPGFLTRQYFEGRRVRWVSPIRLYLVVSLVYFGLTSLTGWGGFDFSVRITGDTDVETQAELAQLGYASEEQLDQAAREAVNVWLPRAMFLLVPIFGGLVGILRRSAGRTYPQHLVFSLHVHAAWFGAFALTALLGGLLGGAVLGSIASGLSILYALAYLVLALRDVYGGSIRRNVVEGLVVGTTYWLLAIGVTIAILMPVVLASG